MAPCATRNGTDKEVKRMVKNVREGTISRNLAHQGLRHMNWPIITYPLPVCTFNENGSDDIILPCYSSLLEELGANKKFLKLRRRSPKTLYGMAPRVNAWANLSFCYPRWVLSTHLDSNPPPPTP